MAKQKKDSQKAQDAVKTQDTAKKHKKIASAAEFTPVAVAAQCQALGFTLSEKELEAVTGYLALLQKWNAVMNLVGPYNWQEMLDILLVDSLHLARFVKTLALPQNPVCWDFGCGAGLPGVTLRILWQDGDYTMVDAREKRIMFIRMVLAQYPLAGTKVERARVEEFMAGRAPANVMLSRAFMPWKDVVALLNGHIAPQGYILILANEACNEQEIPEGWHLASQYEYSAAGAARFFWALSPNA